MKTETTYGAQILSILRSFDVHSIFSSPGSEWPPLWDALAEAQAAGEGPEFHHIRHEETAVSMAIGHYLTTGRLPVVALHSTVGTLKAAMAIRYALHDRIPMVVLAGESSGFGEQATPDPGRQWQRMLSELGGPAALAVPFVKRSHLVTAPEVMLGMLQDACRTALTPPQGPVFLSIPFEQMLGSLNTQMLPSPISDATSGVWKIAPDTHVLDQVADVLIRSEKPVILTEAAGRRPENVTRLVQLAESLSIPVVEAPFPAYVNFHRDHPLHLGYRADAFLAEADTLVVLSCQMPWYPSSRRPSNIKHVIVIDEYPTYDRLAYWGVVPEYTLAGELSLSLDGLRERIISKLEPSRVIGIRTRFESLKALHHEQELARETQLASLHTLWPLDTRWISHKLVEILPEDAIFIEETTVDKDSITQFAVRSQPGTFFSRMSGGLGLTMGMAVGFKLGHPDRIVTALVGDGAFHYSPVPSILGYAQETKSPFMTVVINNGSYASMKASHLKYYPDGWAARTGVYPGSTIDPPPDYALLARAYGGWGHRIEKPDDFVPAVDEATKRLRAGQLVILDTPARPGEWAIHPGLNA